MSGNSTDSNGRGSSRELAEYGWLNLAAGMSIGVLVGIPIGIWLGVMFA